MALPAGTRLGPYEILEPLGAGGMGEVYRARDTRLGREVAVKILPDRSSSPELLRRFEEEARAVAALSHSHILAVHDVGQHERISYIVFELLDGESLRKRITRGALPTRKALEYAVQLCQGLAAAHERGIVHRDLKPENLFLTKDGPLKILDFGLARLSHGLAVEEEERSIATLTKPGTVLGTVGYLSPEQAQGQTADVRSDIFAVGTILYEMLSGRRAFQCDTGPETLAAIIREDPPNLMSPSGPAPPAVERVVRRCLEKEPRDRFQSALDVAFALEALSGASSDAALPTPPPGRRSNPWARAGAVLLVAALAAGAGFLTGTRTALRPLPAYTPITSGGLTRAGPVAPRGCLHNGRFTPDGHTIVYSGAWEGGAPTVHSARVENPVPRQYDFPPGGIQSVSSTGELALLLNQPGSVGWPKLGTLAVAPLAGGVPSPIAEDVVGADWAPDGSLCLVRRVGEALQVEWPPGRVLHRADGTPFREPRVSPRGGQVALSTGRELVLLDRGGERRLLWSHPARGTFGHAWAPGGRELWFLVFDGAGYTNCTLKAVDLSGRVRAVHRFDSTAYLADISPDGRVLAFLWRNTSAVQVEDAEGRTHDFPITWGTVLSPDGTSLAGGAGRTILHDLESRQPVRIGGGGPGRASNEDAAEWTVWDLSEGGRRVLVLEHGASPHLLDSPTGPGEPRPVPLGDVEPSGGRWFPDGRTLLVCGAGPGEAARVYVLGPDDASPRALSPPGSAGSCDAHASPDGRWVALREGSRVRLYPVEGGEAREVPGEVGPDRLLGWSEDGRFLMLRRDPQALPVPARLYRLDVGSGRAEDWDTLHPRARLGLLHIHSVHLARHGRVRSFIYASALHDAYIVDGLR